MCVNINKCRNAKPMSRAKSGCWNEESYPLCFDRGQSPQTVNDNGSTRATGYMLRLDWSAGDGVGIERSRDGKVWENVGYINTGATNSTISLGQDIVDSYNEKHT